MNAKLQMILDKIKFRMLKNNGKPDQMEQAMAMANSNPMLEIANIKEMMSAMNDMAKTCFTGCVDNFRSTMVSFHLFYKLKQKWFL